MITGSGLGSRGRRCLRALLVVLAGSVLLTGCNFNVYSIPLPGGTDVGSEPMTIDVEFADVLDLVPKSSVKVNDVSVGQVKEITLDGDTAVVTIEIKGDVDLPENATATIRQTSLLGEKFVSLEPPATGASSERLASGDTIELADTGSNPEVEQVLGALSLILNGGGVAQLKTITVELNKALEGREDVTRSLLNQVDLFVGQLATRKQDVVDAIESLNGLATEARRQQGSIDQALEELPSALSSIDSQREDLVAMLQSLDRLSDVGVRVIRSTKEDTIETVRNLQPVLTEFSNAGDDFVNAFNVFLTFPFIDEVVGRDPQVARNLQVGDYTNLSVELDLDLTNLPELPGLPGAPAGPPLPELPDACTPLDELPDLPLDDLVDDIRDLCKGAQDAITDCIEDPSFENCTQLPDLAVESVCDAVATPLVALCGRGGSGGGDGLGGLLGGGGGTGGGGLGGLLGGGGGLGLNRPAPSTDEPATAASGRGSSTTTIGDLMAVYDPGLVAGLAGPLAVQP